MSDARADPGSAARSGDIERSHQIKDDEDSRDPCRPADWLEMRHGEEQDPDEAEKRQLAPSLGHRETAQTAYHLTAGGHHGGLERFSEIGIAAPAMEFEFAEPIEQGAVKSNEDILTRSCFPDLVDCTRRETQVDGDC